ncbi:hypothetical protein F442_19472 [Phytophthora nicotianae P10297]|uniref:Uncharacterized protein n=3 Tax=Phytophthora nicotianae TaxID=4792 RepID=W2PKI1_PHYN3|nr:hypothetical protein PPTG_24146 [Phytophthora nicotianae INRA-310]ETI33651.1 hypothetical protein F443_19694 [Phytophthora nicotianae P1569]ETN01131.1 hypothetical protein PPTG_24146 [Phytophthora nicotianae INRA-310]ETP31687.1 hypothetical protein F442_19472 [Phytophthora nicotianae P10297]
MNKVKHFREIVETISCIFMNVSSQGSTFSWESRSVIDIASEDGLKCIITKAYIGIRQFATMLCKTPVRIVEAERQ